MSATGSGIGDRSGFRKRRRAFKWARVALLVHNWLGLKLALILSVVLLSGTLAVFRAEVDWLLYPEMRVTAGETHASLDEIASAIRIAYPDMALVGEIPTGADAGRMAVGVTGVSPDRGVRMIWVDPYAGEVQGDTPLMTPGFFLAHLHRDLFIPEWGIFIVCATAIVIAVSLITGLIAYRRFWRGFFRWPRFRNLRTSMVGLHKLVGLWSLWFAIVITVTGLWYFWTMVGEPKLGFAHPGREWATPQISDARLDAMGPDAPAQVSLAGALANVRARYPDFEAEYVSLPTHHGAPLLFRGSRGEVLAPHGTAVAVDPFTGNVLDAEMMDGAPLLNRFGAMVNPLHFGNFGGLVSKTIWFVFGLGLTGLAVSGVVIFWCRTKRAWTGFAPVFLRAFHPWRGAMGWAKPLNWAVLAVAVVASVMTADFFLSGPGELPARYAPRDVGPWRLGVTLISGLGDTGNPVKPDARVMAIVDYCTGCWVDIKRLWISTGAKPPTPRNRGARVHGQPGFAFAGVQLPSQLGDRQRLWIFAEGWDGRFHTAGWPVGDPAAAQNTSR